ncbi:MAG: FAD-dependent oxidoreductase, partial [Thiotrichaceae bacterium]
MTHLKRTTRRNFLKTLALGTATVGLSFPYLALGATKRVVIVGGGTGGATAAKYLLRQDPTIQVTLIEKNANYLTCYMSNEVLGGSRNIETLRFSYDAL